MAVSLCGTPLMSPVPHPMSYFATGTLHNQYILNRIVESVAEKCDVVVAFGLVLRASRINLRRRVLDGSTLGVP